MPIETLDEIAIKHGTDKATSHPVLNPSHAYTLEYQKVFDPLRNNVLKLLEIGVGGGESIRMWLDYFPSAHVYGVDIVNGTNPWNTVGSGIHDRYTFVTGDQAHDVFWKCFIADYGSNWDIIIDDGGHFSNQIITTFDCMWDHVSPRGLYCIEDLGVAYGESTIFVPDGWPNHMDFIRTILDKVNTGNGNVECVRFSRELAIIQRH